MVIHVAFGEIRNLLLHLPAIAHAAGIRRPSAAEWAELSRKVPRLVDALPNRPTHYATVQVFLAGGTPEVMLHLRDLGLLRLGALTVTGRTLGENLAWWERSERRKRLREKLAELDGVDPDRVILSPKAARAAGLTGTVTFLHGNLSRRRLRRSDLSHQARFSPRVRPVTVESAQPQERPRSRRCSMTSGVPPARNT